MTPSVSEATESETAEGAASAAPASLATASAALSVKRVSDAGTDAFSSEAANSTARAAAERTYRGEPVAIGGDHGPARADP